VQGLYLLKFGDVLHRPAGTPRVSLSRRFRNHVRKGVRVFSWHVRRVRIPDPGPRAIRVPFLPHPDARSQCSG
jgi:hypothetical protein